MSTLESQRQLFLFETFDLISNTTILGALYGVSFILYCFCAQLLYSQSSRKTNKQQTRFMLGYISLIMFCAMAYLILSSRMAQVAYIDHADFPGGPLEYEQSYDSTTRIYETITGVFDFILEVLTMGVQVWRLWIIWSGTQYATAVIVLPSLLLLSYIGMDVVLEIVATVLPIEEIGITEKGFRTMDTVSYAVLPAFTTIVTGLVIIRILSVRSSHIKILGTSDTSSPYTSITAMLTESYTLESAWSIAAAISGGVHSPSYFLFMVNDSTIKVIAYFLIVYRVASGRGWTRDTEQKLTSIQWGNSSQTVAA